MLSRYNLLAILAQAAFLCCGSPKGTRPETATRVPEAIGCAKDSDCRGGRICNAQDRCEEPGKGSAAWEEPPAARVGAHGSPAFAMFRGNSRHTGLYNVDAPKIAPKLKWSVDLGGTIAGTPTVGPDGNIFLTSHSKNLYAVDPSGTIKWTFKTGDRLWSTPALAVDGTLYIGSDDDHLYAVDSKTGKQKWRQRLGSCKEPLGFGPDGTRCDVDGGPMIDAEGAVYTGGDGVHALWSDGTLRWKFATTEHVRSALAWADTERYYATCLNDSLYALNNRGEKEWEFRTKRDIESSPAITGDGQVVFGSDDKSIYSVNPDGEKKWSVVTGGFVRASAAVDLQDNIYVGSYDHNFYAVDKSGNVLWRFKAADKIHSSALLTQNGILLFGSRDDHVYALDLDGQLLWYIDVGADVDTTPMLATDGMLYVGADDGVLRAYQ